MTKLLSTSIVFYKKQSGHKKGFHASHFGIYKYSMMGMIHIHMYFQLLVISSEIDSSTYSYIQTDAFSQLSVSIRMSCAPIFKM